MSVDPLRLGIASVFCILAFSVAPASAQRLEGSIGVYNNPHLPDGLVTGRNGDALLLTSQSGGLPRTIRIARGTVRLDPGVPVTEDGGDAKITALAGGGFAAVWLLAVPLVSGETPHYITTQRLSSRGVPFGFPHAASGPADSLGRPGIAALDDGFVAGWVEDDIFHRRFDVTGSPIGGPFDAGAAGVSDVRMAAVGAGFLMTFGRDFDIGARLFASNGTALGPRFTVAESFEPSALAVNAAGTLAAIVGKAHSSDPNPHESRLRFFAPNGSFVGNDIVLGYGIPGVGTDPHGNFLVAFGSPLQVRAYDPNGVPLGPVVALDIFSEPRRAVVTGRREGGFLIAWGGYDQRLRVARVTLCVPGSAVCGDGTLSTTCEICDAGAGNSDVVADACRSDCRPARCGDAVVDAGEQCDDGNAENCDGCDEFCASEVGTTCGDGIVAPQTCREQCDDANASDGDGCSSGCQVERIPGGGSSTTDCWAAWRIDNPSNDPRYGKRGTVNPKQACRDNDPACDFDGGLAGSCTFHLGVCVNNSEPSECTPSRLLSWTLATPNAKQALARPDLAAVRAALDAAVLTTVVGTSDANQCSPAADVVVPLRGGPGAFKAGKLKLKSRAAAYSGIVDTDTLHLRCDPS